MEELVAINNNIDYILSKISEKGKNEVQIIKLPCITVAGSQSAGKSSVLESILGCSFLPRGYGKVTRTPIEIQLTNKCDPKKSFYFEFCDLKGQEFTDLELVRKQIQTLTNQIAGPNGISPKKIKMIYHSPKVLDMLLIDLPGIVKNPLPDEDPNIREKILDIYKEYLSNKECIILAVSKGNDDLANSEGINIAKKYDNTEERIFSVLTHLDMVPKENNIKDALNNKEIILKNGHIGVICGGFKEIEEQKSGVSNQEILEAQYFKRHELYSQLTDQLGIPFLRRKLHVELGNRIRNALPRIEKQIKDLITAKEIELAQYGQEIDPKTQNMTQKALAIIKDFKQRFNETIPSPKEQIQPTIQKWGRINLIFKDEFEKAIDSIPPVSMKDPEIISLISNTNRYSPPILISDRAFSIMIENSIKRFQAPSLECAELIDQELHKIAYNVKFPEFEAFPNFRKKLLEIVDKIYEKCLKQTFDLIKNFFRIHIGSININHPKFIGFNDIFSVFENNLREDMQNPSMKKIEKNLLPLQLEYSLKKLEPELKIDQTNIGQSSKEKSEVHVLIELVKSYVNIMKVTVKDMIPKIIITMLINESKSLWETELVDNMIKFDVLDYVFQEDPMITKSRKDAIQIVTSLKDALEECSKVDKKLDASFGFDKVYFK